MKACTFTSSRRAFTLRPTRIHGLVLACMLMRPRPAQNSFIAGTWTHFGLHETHELVSLWSPNADFGAVNAHTSVWNIHTHAHTTQAYTFCKIVMHPNACMPVYIHTCLDVWWGFSNACISVIQHARKLFCQFLIVFIANKSSVLPVHHFPVKRWILYGRLGEKCCCLYMKESGHAKTDSATRLHVTKHSLTWARADFVAKYHAGNLTVHMSSARYLHLPCQESRV